MRLLYCRGMKILLVAFMFVGVFAIGLLLGRLTVQAPPFAAVAVDRPTVAPVPAVVRVSASRRYFQRMLIEYGADAGSTFGGDLASLGLPVKGRDLQALPNDDAYDLAHASATRIGDIAMRRRYFLELFNEVD